MHQKQTYIVFHHSFPVKSKITSAEMCDKIVSSIDFQRNFIVLVVLVRRRREKQKMIRGTRTLWSILCITLVSSEFLCPDLPSGHCIHDCSTNSDEQDVKLNPNKNPKEIVSFQVSNCRSLSLPNRIFKFPVTVILKNIGEVKFIPGGNFGPNQANMKRKFVMENCHTSKFESNMFYRLNFSKIEIRNSAIDRLGYQVFKYIIVDHLVISDTRIDTIADEAFDLRIKKQLTFKNNTVSHMHADSFTAMTVDPTISISLEKNTMNELLSSKFHLNFDPSMNKVSLSKVTFHDNVINEACGCDLFGVSESNHSRVDLGKFIYGKLMLSFQCIFKNQAYHWIDFDKLRCEDDHDHDEEFKKFFDSKF